MEWQTLINIGAGSTLAVIGWFARELWDAVNVMKKDLHRLEVKIAKDYATHQDLNARFDKIEMILGKIFDKLDNKVDK
jgi:spore coat polysaccharide biosynthesis protein SpsF (cytidylyltransferase family)